MMIPNIITSIRFIAIFPLAISIYLNGINSIIPFIVFLLIILTDFVDGFIARKFNMITDFGKAFDPIVDRTLFLVTTIALLLKDLMPIYSLFIYIRDIIIAILSFIYVKNKKKIIGANIYGKIKTVLHFISLALVLLLKSWNIYSLILIILSFITIIPEVIFRYKQYFSEE